jgi:hypothetical protein
VFLCSVENEKNTKKDMWQLRNCFDTKSMEMKKRLVRIRILRLEGTYGQYYII